MSRIWSRLLIPVLLFLLTLGCGNRAAEEMGGAVAADWEAASKLDGEDGLMPVAYAASRNDWGTAKTAAANPKFEQSVEDFAKAPIPKGWEDRADERDAAVADLRALIKAGKSGSIEELKTAYNKSIASVKLVRGPPEGQATEKK